MATAARVIRPHVSLSGLIYRVVDAASIAAGLLLACQVGTPEGFDPWWAWATAVVMHFLTAELTGQYRNWRGVSLAREIACVLGTWGLAFTAAVALAWVLDRPREVPPALTLLWGAATPLVMLTAHGVLRAVRRALWQHGVNTRPVAIVGVTKLGIQLGQNINRSPELGLKLVGYYDDRPPERNPELPAGLRPQVGTLDDLVAEARAGRVGSIYITFPMRAEARIRGVLSRLADSTASVYVVPDFFVFELLHSRWTDVGGLPAVSVFETPLYGVDGLVKRGFDLVVGGAILLTVAVPMLVVAALIKLTMPGPIFFRQKRYGLDGREILVWKFRSMRVCENGPTIQQATKQDPRVTPLGAVLRRTSLDELPQLFNVLDGSMSLVGPRPHATAHNEQYRGLIQGYMLRHKVKPGITGLAQVRGWRGETDTLEKMVRRVECDHEYIRDWSLWNDIAILLRTVLVVLKRENAY